MARPVLLASLLTLAAPVLAQIAPGDWVLSDASNGATALIRVDPTTGQASTILAGQPAGHLNAVFMDRNNVDLAAVQTTVNGAYHVVSCTPLGVLSTIVALGPGPLAIDAALDQDGTFVGLSVGGGGLWRSDPATGRTTLLVPTGNRIQSGLCLDGDTGDYVLAFAAGFSTIGELLRVDRRTLAVTTILGGLGTISSVDFEPASGDFVVTDPGFPHLLRVHRSGAWSTVNENFPPDAQAVRVDPETANLLAGGGGTVGLLGPTGTLIRSHAPPVPGLTITGLELYGSRKVSGAGPATGGSAYQIRFAFPQSAGRAYVAALSTGLRPGFALADGTGRTIQLDVTSPLFPISIGGLPGLTTGFAGVLDGSGQATGSILIPAGFPAGFRLFVSAVALHPGLPSGLDTANTWGVTTN
jgi:hypothetical protein